jgi:hypothetical protein
LTCRKASSTGNFVHPIGEVIDRTRALIDVFHTKNFQLVLVNVARRPPGRTEQGPRSTHERRVNVTLTLDAMTDLREEAHEYSIRNVFPRVGETGSTQEIIALLEKRSATS